MNHRNLGWNKRLRSGLIGALGLLGMLCLGHCYRPTYEGPYSCDPAHASVDCPDGWSCQNGLCTAPGSATVATGACSGAGTLLAMSRGGQVWACEGSFASGNYRNLCASRASAHVCGTERSDDSLLGLIDCDALRGFYMSGFSLALGGPPPPQPICDGGPSPNQAVLGCGSIEGIVRLSGPDCHGLRHAMFCPSTSIGWSCDRTRALGSVAHTASDSSPGGTLCCEDAAK